MLESKDGKEVCNNIPDNIGKKKYRRGFLLLQQDPGSWCNNGDI